MRWVLVHQVHKACRASRLSVVPRSLQHVRLTLRISCEAVPPSILPAGAQGGTSARRSGAALSFVSCIRLLGSPLFERRCFAAAEWAALSFGETISD